MYYMYCHCVGLFVNLMFTKKFSHFKKYVYFVGGKNKLSIEAFDKNREFEHLNFILNYSFKKKKFLC